MQQLRNGVMLFLVLALASCRRDSPPKIPICIGDGIGGADCVLADGSKAYLAPSQLQNAWITTQEGMEKFASWCYRADRERVAQEMAEVAEAAKNQ